MKISIVTSVLNQVNTINDTIESVRLQTYADFEYIIQDGGSTDGTIDIISRSISPIIKFKTEFDSGIYDGINRGIRRASGDIIGLLHSDDVFAHSKVLEMIAFAFQDPKVDGVYGDLDYVSPDDLTRVIRRWRSGSYRPSKLRFGWMPPHPTLYLRRSTFEKFGYYDTDFKISADYEAILRFLVRGKLSLYYIPDVLVRMRLGGVSNRSISNLVQKTLEDYRAIRRHKVGGLRTLFMKNARKLGQFLIK